MTRMSPSKDMPAHLLKASRVPYFDNVKFALMACVVVGHLLKTGGALHFRYARAAFLFIYSFHMPLFVLVSGLFLKRGGLTWEKTKKRSLSLFGFGLLAKLLRSVFPWLLGRPLRFSLFVEGGLPWFMFALAAYHLLAWLLRNADGLAVLGGSVAVSLIAGYIPAIGDGLCLSRIIVFFPFFWLGHLLTPAQVRRLYAQRGVRVGCAVALLLCLLVFVTWTKPLWPYRRLFWGRTCYANTRIENCTMLNRLAAYALSCASSAAVLGVILQRDLGFVTHAGTRTLQVYLLHFEVIDFLQMLRFTWHIVHVGSWGFALMVPLGIAITLVLSLPDFRRLIFSAKEGSHGGQQRALPSTPRAL